MMKIQLETIALWLQIKSESSASTPPLSTANRVETPPHLSNRIQSTAEL